MTKPSLDILSTFSLEPHSFQILPQDSCLGFGHDGERVSKEREKGQSIKSTTEEEKHGGCRIQASRIIGFVLST